MQRMIHTVDSVTTIGTANADFEVIYAWKDWWES